MVLFSHLAAPPVAQGHRSNSLSCHLGRQYFNDPLIGDYSITYTQAGGVNGNTQDGLHHPILQVADVGPPLPYINHLSHSHPED